MILLAGAVRGLVSEGERMALIFARERPDALALSISREGIDAMEGDGKAMEAVATNPEEEVYIEWLSDFGEIIKPPPCFSMPLGAARKAGIAAEPLDMDDEHYTAAYCKYVGTLDMMRQGSMAKRLSKHRFTAKTPEQFVLEWDAEVNRLNGFRDLESAREAWMAKGMEKLSKKHGTILVVVELERLAGTAKHLEALGLEYKLVQ